MPVVGFDVKFQRVLADGKSWGDVGPYEEFRGTLRFAVDPLNEANSRITDIELAPRNEAGLVEFSSDTSIILPVDRSRGSGRLLLDVVNRGNRVGLPAFNRAERPIIGPDTPDDFPVDLGDGFLMKRGYTVVACGWQSDAPDFPALLTLNGPEALTADGQRITGRVYTQLQSPADTHNFLLSDKGHKAYQAFDMEERNAVMEVRDMPDGEAQLLRRDSWRFGRIDDDGNYIADPDYVCSDKGFEKGRLYQIVYTTIGATVLGVSFAALRDCVSWVKYGTESESTPIEGIRYAYAYGRSQTGRYLRTYIYNDLNLDERGREALDGIISNVAGGMRGEFNQRFGQNSKDRNNMMTQIFPMASVPQTDLETEETDSIHRRIDERGNSLKVMYTNTSAEYHRCDASLAHTDPDGIGDIDVSANARVYHYGGTEHGNGLWPPSDIHDVGEGQNRSRNMRSVIDYKPLERACLVNLDRWVSCGEEPPSSRYPNLTDGTLVVRESLRVRFASIPGVSLPDHLVPFTSIDYGSDVSRWRATKLPPKIGPRYPDLVSDVDEDGNEVGGIRLPDVEVPLATYTGWNTRHSDMGGEGQAMILTGATLVFPRTAEEREERGDPRLSIAERYASKEEYLTKVRRAAERLVSEGYMLKDDVEGVVEQSRERFDQFTT